MPPVAYLLATAVTFATAGLGATLAWAVSGNTVPAPAFCLMVATAYFILAGIAWLAGR